MPERKAIQTRIAERLAEFKADFVPRVAELRRPVLGNVTVSKDERRRRWWQEDDGWTPEREAALLAGGMSREDVGILKYPYREVDARAAGRGDPRKEALYAKEMSDLGPPEPDPLETAAQSVEAGAGPQVQEPSLAAIPSGLSMPAAPEMASPPPTPEMGGY